MKGKNQKLHSKGLIIERKKEKIESPKVELEFHSEVKE